MLHGLPDSLIDLAMEMRAIVLAAGPELDEKIAFHSLCYSKRGRPYGVIGGNVCMISPKDGALELGFIHGASLSDPQGLLEGSGKAKRHVKLKPDRDLRRNALKALVRAALSVDPTDPGFQI